MIADAGDGDPRALERGRGPGDIATHRASQQPGDRLSGRHHECRTERGQREDGKQRGARRIVAEGVALGQRQPDQDDGSGRQHRDVRGAAVMVEELEHGGPVAEGTDPMTVGHWPHG